jgi:ribonucleoside-diphosphate reductase alpha chain
VSSYLYFSDSEGISRNSRIEFSDNAKTILEKRYLRRNEKGELAETPEQMFDRVARAVAEPDRLFRDAQKTEIEFYNLLSSKKFFPNSPTFTGADTPLGQLAACFVLPISDDLGREKDGIFSTLRVAALIQQSGGGNGFSFSKLRSKGSIVSRSNGVATGPIGFLKVYDVAFGEIAQGGVRRGANMGVLRVDHPDIRDFIKCKSDEGNISNFNISVAITDKFMEAVKNDTTYELIDPHTKEVKERPRAREIFDMIVDYAYKNGEPGVLFIDTANKYNPVPHLFELESTNPCGEQWLGPYENCCLGSINLLEMVDSVGHLDWEELRRTIILATRFLDNVVSANTYIPAVLEIKEAAQNVRRIGLGFMGLADVMYSMGIRYGSDEGQEFSAQVSEFIRFHAMKSSVELAKERGPFPKISGSIYDPANLKWSPPKPLRPYLRNWNRPEINWEEIINGIRFYGIRNAATTTIAPTGTISTVAGIEGYGCEPVFALAYYRKVYQAAGDLGKMTLTYVSPSFQKAIDGIDLSQDVKNKIVDEVASVGSCQHIKELPDTIKKVFAVSADITPEEHIQTQASIQAFIDNSISKTCNFPSNASREDVAKVYVMGWELGCKGLTVYVTGSRTEVVLETKGAKDIKIPIVEEKKDLVTAEVHTGLERGYKLSGNTYKVKTPQGKAFITVNKTPDGKPFEVFLNVGKAGSDVSGLSEGLGRVISGWLREPHSSGETGKEIISQLIGIGGTRSVGFGKTKVSSIPDAIAKVLADEFGFKITSKEAGNENNNGEVHEVETDEDSIVTEKEPESSAFANTDVCPECGNCTLVQEEGCAKCYSCGYSHC